MKRFRETKLGRFVTQAQADADPAGTVAETVSDAPQVEANLRWRVKRLEPALIQSADAMRRAAVALGGHDGLPTLAAALKRQAAEAEAVYHDTIPEERAE